MRSARVGLALRTLRLRRGWTQQDLAEASGVSRWRIGRIERDRLKAIAVGAVEAIADALDASLVMSVEWKGAELDRLINARHAILHEAAARFFAQWPDWAIAAEVSFSIYGERGVFDILAYHRASRTLLVIELKTEVVDPQALLGNIDRKIRLAGRVARERGWDSRTVGAWVIFTDTRSNRRHVDGYSGLLKAAFPVDGRAIRVWLAAPSGAIRALSFLSVERHALRDQLPVMRRRARAARRRAVRGADTVV